MNKILAGKKGLVMGVANERSIAWAMAKQAAEQGAELAFTYQGEALEKRVRPLVESIGSKIFLPCDVTDGDSIKSVFDAIKKEWGEIDFLVHAIAFSNREELKGRYVDTTKDNFLQTMHISCFSLTEISRHAAELMPNGGSIVTLTYHGSQKYIPHYNVMGVAKAALEASVRYLAMDLGPQNIRVNAISAGPVKTLAAAGIGDFRFMMKWNAANNALKRNMDAEEVAKSGLYFLSDMSSAVSGEVHYVDCGYSINGMIRIDSLDEIQDVVSG